MIARRTFENDRNTLLPESKWRHIGQHFLAHPWITTAIVACSLLQAACEALAAVLVAVVLQQIGQGSSDSSLSPGILRALPDLLQGLDTKTGILAVGASLSALALVRLFAFVGANHLAVVLKSAVSRSTQDMLHAHLLAAPLEIVDRLDTGEVMATVILHADRVGSLTMAVATFIPRVVTMTALLGLLIGVSAATAGIMLSVLLLPWLITRYLLKRLRRLASVRTAFSGNVQQFMAESFGGLRDIRASVNEVRRHQEFIATMDHHQRMAVSANSIQLSIPNVGESLGLFGIGIILVLAALFLSQFSVSWLGEVMIGLFLMVRLLPAASAVSGLRSRMADCASAYEHAYTFLRRTHNVDDHGNGEPFTGIGSGLAFDRLSFAYQEGKRPALKDVSFGLPAVGLAVVVGGSGAGKSTLLQVLLRFRRPDVGQVRVGGKDLATIDREAWRASIGVVPQDPFLFNTTIAANIALKRPDASREEIERAAKLAEIHDFIRGLESGYDTKVGDRGVALSGGQRQRLAIARGLIARPALLILDEATGSLDPVTESQILETIRRISLDILVVMVTHRLAVARKADIVVVLDNGALAGIGSPDDLMMDGACPAFRNLVESDRNVQRSSPAASHPEERPVLQASLGA